MLERDILSVMLVVSHFWLYATHDHCPVKALNFREADSTAMTDPCRSDLRLALFQPDLALNTGAMLRTAACLGVAVDIIEPCGFPFSLRALRRSGMDYLAQVAIHRHADWTVFLATVREAGRRLVLVETDGAARLHDFSFMPGDVLMVGRETVGTPSEVASCADASVRIPMAGPARSFNVGVAAAIALAEALRQRDGWPR